jgi:molybdopterin converting factor small subunit
VRVNVRLLGALGDQAGTAHVELDLPEGATYRQLLDRLAPTLEPKLASWAWDCEKRSFGRQMMVTRNLSGDLRDESTVLTEGDEILVLLPLAGG